ncbi:MAG TPA: hypothetical protein DGG94_09570 [Micromonosporaceae bacterium]|nr:hypothetical protein [Micromonosporaceae bacterium]HCU50031.1 hypothetical protein [Micromonosporaceae bacterium]
MEAPPERRDLAAALVDLYEGLGLSSLKQAESLLASGVHKIDSGQISRYLNAKRLPPKDFVDRLCDLAFAQVGPERIQARRQYVLDLYSKATDAQRKTRSQLHFEIGEMQDSCDRLRRYIAGLEARLAAGAANAAPLPVPAANGDRQRKANEVALARQLADKAATLRDQGEEDAALSLLRETSDVLSPLECAATLVLLRQQHEAELAETLIQIYGRDQTKHRVILAALELHEFGLPDDVGAMLRSAAE